MTTRTYRQTRRADATGRTREAILDAAQALFRADPQLDPSLDAVAARAGVSTRTVIRQFGSKEGLLEAAITAGIAQIATTRYAAPGDVAGAVGRLVEHYEAMGDEVVRRLALGERLPVVRRVTERGTESHLEWVEAVFAPDLEGLPRGGRRAGPVRRCRRSVPLRRQSRLQMRSRRLAVARWMRGSTWPGRSSAGDQAKVPEAKTRAPLGAR